MSSINEGSPGASTSSARKPRRITRFQIFRIAALAALLSILPASASAERLFAQCIRVKDGDTVVLALQIDSDPLGSIIAIESARLKNIDTPELNDTDPKERERARSAAKFVSNVLDCPVRRGRKHKTQIGLDPFDFNLTVITHGRGKYGRLLVTILLGKTTLSGMLLLEGHQK